MTTSDVDVVILNYRTPELAIEAAQSVVQEGADSVWLVDNCSGDRSATRLRESKKGIAKVLSLSQNLGFAAGNNRGASQGERELILFMNADTELQPGALKAMIYPFEDPSVGAVGPTLHYPNGLEQGSAYLFPTPWRITTALLRLDVLADRWGGSLFASNVDPHRNGFFHGPVECLYGACFMVRRAAYTAVGCFDEEFFLYYDETDFFLRLRSAGWINFRAADANAIHHHGQSAKDIPSQSMVFMQESRSIYARKHFNRFARFYVGFVSIAGLVVRILVSVRSSNRARYWPALGWWFGWTASPDPRKYRT